MRKALILILLNIGLCQNLNSQISEEKLLAYFPFNGDVLDYSQNGFHGTLIGGEFVSDLDGNANSALRFNGSSDYINLSVFAEVLKDNINEVSIYFKVKFEGSQEFQSILSLGNHGEMINNNVFEIEYENDQIQVETETGTDAINHELQIDQTEFVLDQNWHQILIKINQDSLTYCRDNVLIYKDEYIPMETTTNELFVGCFDGNNLINSCCHLSGVLDELQIYSSVDILEKDTVSFIGCESDNYEIIINGTQYDITNPQGNELIDSNCCIDTLYSINLIFNEEHYAEINEVHCLDSNFEVVVNNVIYNANNPEGLERMTTINQCDSLIAINLEFEDFIEIEILEDFCENEDQGLIINGNVYNQFTPSGTEYIEGFLGCDTIFTIDLNYNPVKFDTIRYIGCSEDDFQIEINNNLYNSQNPKGIETLNSSIGCDSIVTIDLNFDTEECKFYFPNIINPHSENIINRSFYPGSSFDCNFIVKEYFIFDRWGNKLHSNPLLPWKGKFEGKTLLSGVYTYFIKIESTCGELMKTGSITVVY
jgi:hypothetical protein